ncbi:MAG: ribosome biogenesis GTPase Der [bacterium]
MTLTLTKIEPLVAIVGRKNVGKSSLFNRLIEESKAIISPFPGTTRDVNYGACLWRAKTFFLADTAGFDIVKKNELEEKSAQQSLAVVKKASLIAFLIDGQIGITADDRAVLKKIRLLQKPIIFVANKIDNQRIRNTAKEAGLEKLGLGSPFFVSATNGSGSGDLLDKIISRLKFKKSTPEIKKIKIALIGKPNVGKSSLLNKLLGREEILTSPRPQTTLEPQEREIIFNQTPLIIIDTAGIKKWTTQIEKIIINKSLRALKKANMAILLLDVSQKITKQDIKLSDLILKSQKPALIAVNKIDLLTNFDQKSRNDFTAYAQTILAPLKWSPVFFVSAKSGVGLQKILETAVAIYKTNEITLTEEELKGFIREARLFHKPLRAKGKKHPKIYDFRQTRITPPEFTVFIGPRDTLHTSYLKYLENRLRKKINLSGLNIKIKVKNISL